MIKKSLFEKELEVSMQQELRKMASSDTPDLVKAGECLHAALEIFEEAGMQRQANAVLKLLAKIAQDNQEARHDTRVQTMPAVDFNLFFESGMFSPEDLRLMFAGDQEATAKINVALHEVGWSDGKIASVLGSKMMPYHHAKKIMNNVTLRQKYEASQPSFQPGQEMSFQSLKKEPTLAPSPGEEALEFKSIANKHRKPKNPLKIKDPHTKGLTPAKMVENLKHHGTEFNMADDMSADFDEEVSSALGVHRMDELDVDILPPSKEIEDQDWETWKNMVNEEMAPTRRPQSLMPPTMRSEVPKKPVLDPSDDLYGLLAADDFNVDDDLEVTDEVPLDDFEDERH